MTVSSKSGSATKNFFLAVLEKKFLTKNEIQKAKNVAGENENLGARGDKHWPHDRSQSFPQPAIPESLDRCFPFSFRGKSVVSTTNQPCGFGDCNPDAFRSDRERWSIIF